MINSKPEKEFWLQASKAGILIPSAIFGYVLLMMLLAYAFLILAPGHSVIGPNHPEESRNLFFFLSGVQLLLIGFISPELAVRAARCRKRNKWPLNLPGDLFASVRMMLQLVASTLPVYLIILLFSGLSVFLLAELYALYFFVIFVIGAAGMFAEERTKGKKQSTLLAYGIVLFMYMFTGLLASILQELYGTGALAGFILGLNPMGALLSVLNPEFSKEAFGPSSSIQLWQISTGVYSALAVLFLRFSFRK